MVTGTALLEIDPVPCAIIAWLAALEAARVDPRELQASVDAFMAEFDAQHDRVSTRLSPLLLGCYP